MNEERPYQVGRVSDNNVKRSQEAGRQDSWLVVVVEGEAVAQHGKAVVKLEQLRRGASVVLQHKAGGEVPYQCMSERLAPASDQQRPHEQGRESFHWHWTGSCSG